jgi:hypothetical protein
LKVPEYSCCPVTAKTVLKNIIMMIMSLNILKEENMALSIILRDGTLEIVRRGLKILSVLRAARLAPFENLVSKEDTTIMKSRMFHVFFR